MTSLGIMSLGRLSVRVGALLIAIAAGKAALAETAVPFEQVYNLGNDQGIRIELDPSDDVLVFNGGTYILWGRNLEIHAGRIQVNADTIIQAFPRGTVSDLASDGAPGAFGANGGNGGPGYPGIAAGTVVIRGTSIEGSGRLIILNDGMDGGARRQRRTRAARAPRAVPAPTRNASAKRRAARSRRASARSCRRPARPGSMIRWSRNRCPAISS